MMEDKPEKSITRRNFIGMMWAGVGALLGGELLVALYGYLKPVASSGFGGKIYAGKVDEFAVDSVTRILSGRFYIVRFEEGFLALWQKCTHLGCAIPWAQEEDQFHCPCHGSLFNKMGEVTGGPAPRPMDFFPVEVKNGEVWVDTSKPTQRSSFDLSQVTPA